MDNNKTKVLLIEDNPGDARLIREFLAEAKDAPFHLEHVDCLSKGLSCLAQGGIGAILLDLSLPDSQGLDGLSKILAQTLVVPIVVLSGLKDEAVAIKAVQEGAQDYLVKGNSDSSLLVHSLHYAIERQRLRVALRENEARYRLLADNIADVIWTADLKGRITYVSPSIKNFLGYTVDETVKLEMKDILTPDSIEQAKRLIRDQIALWNPRVNHTPLSLTLEHIRKDGSTLWSEVKLSFLSDQKGNITGILGVTRDITDRKRAEEALRKSEALYRLLADNVGDVIWTMDMKGRITYVSPSATHLFGYSVDEIMALKIRQLLTPASVETARKVIEEELAINTPGAPNTRRSAALEHVRKDGSTVWAEVMMSFLRDEQGRVRGVLGVTRDISERKKAESALRESEAQFRTVFEGTGLGIALVDFNGKALDINPAFEQMLGYNLKEFKELEGSLKYLYPEDAMVDAKLYIEMLKGKREHYTVDKRYIRKDGAVIWARQNLSVVRDDKGKPKYFIAMIEDFTERKLMEEELRRSEERYRELFENANDIIYTHDLAGNFTSINKAGERVTGYKRDEVMSMNLSGILSPASLEQARQMMARKLNQGGRTQYELEIITKDGHRVLLEVSTRLIYAEGKPAGVQGIARDITERKKMEQKLLRLSDAFKMSTDSIVITDLEGNVVDSNEAAMKLQGADSKADLIGLHFSNSIVPEEHERALKDLAQVMDKGYVSGIEYHVLTRDGKKILVETNVSLMKGKNGEPMGLVAVIRDITERKRVEEDLRLLSDAVKMSKESIVITDLEGRIIEANEATLKMHGMDNREDLIGREALELIVPEDHAMLTEKMTKGMVSGELTCLEYHSITKDGRKILVEANVSVMRDRNGEPIGYMAVVHDITERRQMEDEVRRLSDAVRMSAESIFVADLEGRVLDANEAAVKMFGAIDKSDLLSKGVLELIAPEDHEKAFENIKRVSEGEKANPEEYRIVRKDGSRNLSELSASVVMGGDGKPTGFVVVGHDITERKRMEDALRQSEQSYRVLLESTHDSIIVVDAETFKVTFGNRRASMMFGFDPVLQDGIGTNLLDFIHPEDREKAIKGFMEDLYQAERRRRYDVRAKTQDGREIWVSALGTRIEFKGRLAVLLSLRDVTKDKQMEEEKRKLGEQVQIAGRLAAVGELAAGVAHELNNPLTAIKGFAQLLTVRSDLDETVRKDLATIYRESQRAAKITQNLLSFARRYEPEKHLISINEALEKTLELRVHQMKLNNIEVEANLDPDLPQTMADFHQMQQVFMNIVNNAEQAMIEAHGKGVLQIRTKKSGEVIQITFADNGPGISEENLKRIFDPFFTTKEVGRGTGLGLSICYGLVEAHGGRIYARSKLGEGATFIVELPIVSEAQLVVGAAVRNPGGRRWKKREERY